MTDAAITNQDPKTFVAGTEGEPTDKTSLIVDFEIRNDDPHLHFVTTTSRLVAELPGGSVVPGVDLERPGAPPSSTVEGRYAFEIPTETRFDDVILRFEDPATSHRSTCRSVEAHRHPRRTRPSTSTGRWRSACPGLTCDGPSMT